MKRQPDRENSNHDRTRKNRRRPIRLVLEPLEARRLLAGLNVSIFVDQDGSRTVDTADTAATRRVVFLDLNRNGLQDSTDPVAFTNDRGIATFNDLAGGDYAVGIAGGSSLQSQSFPIRVGELATSLGPAARNLVASDDLSQVWAFDANGRGRSLSSIGLSDVQLDGEILTSVSRGSEAWVITRSANGQISSRISKFNLTNGQLTFTEIRGLDGRAVNKLVESGSAVVAQLSGPRGIELAKLTVIDGIPTIGAAVSFPNLVTLSGAANQLAVLEYRTEVGFSTSTPRMQALATKLTVFGLEDFSAKATTILPQPANEIAMSSDGRLVLAAFSAGGVLVLNNDSGHDSGLTATATLAEASGPLLTQSRDGRLVTGNSGDGFEFIVWDANTWQPLGRTRVTSSPQTSQAAAAISQAVLANTGDRLISTGTVGTVSSQLAQPTLASVTVPLDGVASVQLGVRINGENRSPSATPVSMTFLEDNAASGELRSQVADADNDTLWFSVLSSPSHGSLRVAPTGEWTYQPRANFNGTDRAIVRVYDGRASSDIAIVLNVTAVNDMPSEIRVDLPPIAENLSESAAIEGLGFVTVFDADRDARYKFETSDDRFQVRNGRIYLAPTATLDFETEPSIEFDVIATEDPVSGYQISTTATLSVSDVNEPPTAIKILNTSVSENLLGATVGQVEVDDPDRINHFEYVLSDPRFKIEDGFLKLKPEIKLDFEQANLISMTITVSDSSGSTLTQPLTITVEDNNDAPSAVEIKTRPIEEATPGAVVGTVLVHDQDGQAYEYTVSDPRFEVVDGVLRLKDGQTVDKSADAGLTLTVIATSVLGSDSVKSSVGVPVVAKKSPFQNPVEPRDVNGDGQITPLDVLILINYMNSFGPGPLGGNIPRDGSGEAPVWVDVNGDGVISPIDILLIINWLNARRYVAQPMPSAEGESSLSSSGSAHAVGGATSNLASTSVSGVKATSFTSRQNEADGKLACPAVESRADSEIDHELESLLDQLSRERLTFPD